MDAMRWIVRGFEYDSWANREAIESLRELDHPPLRGIAIAAHVIAAQWLWLDRLEPGTRTVAIWPDWSLEKCVDEESQVVDAWQAYLSSLDEDRLQAPVRYRNSKGEHYINVVRDILQHVALHSAHHRGQIALLVRESGSKPAYTDFIHAVRQGLVE